MNTRRGARRLLGTLIVALFAGCGARPSGPALEFDRATHEFAAGKEGRVKTSFIVRNSGTETLKIERVETSCPCTTANMEKHSLPAGETAALNVTVDRPGIGAQRTTVQVYSNATPNSPRVVELTCWANDNRPRIVEYRPHQIALRNLDADGSVEVRIAALERTSERLISSSECDLPFVAIVEASDERQPTMSSEFVLHRYQFEAHLLAGHPFGRFNGQVIFHVNLSEGDRRSPRFVLPISVVAVPPVYSEPDVLFSTIPLAGPLPEWSTRINARAGVSTGAMKTKSSSTDWLQVELEVVSPPRATLSDVQPVNIAELKVRVTNRPAALPARAEAIVTFDDDLLEIRIPVVVTAAASATGQDPAD